MQGVSPTGVFCDYLTVTFSPEDSPLDGVRDLILDLPLQQETETLWRTVDHGVIRAGLFRGVDTITFSGRALEDIRIANSLAPFLQLFVEHPHNVTRCDLARDISPTCTPTKLSQLRRAANAGRISLSRHVVKPNSVKCLMGRRDDGKFSGTIYLGRKSQRVFARVYDKALELLEHRGMKVDHELLRYEVVCRKNTASLRDVWEPDPLFYKLCSPDLMARPRGVSEYKKMELNPMSLPKPIDLTDYQRALSLLHSSPDLAKLKIFVGRNGPAFQSLVVKHISAAVSSMPTSADESIEAQA